MMFTILASIVAILALLALAIPLLSFLSKNTATSTNGRRIALNI